MNIEAFITGYRAAARVAIATAEQIEKDYYGLPTAPVRMTTALEAAERDLRLVLTQADPYAAWREFFVE